MTVPQLPVHVFARHHLARARGVVGMLARLGFAELPQRDPAFRCYAHPEPVSGDVLPTLWWALDHLARTNGPLSLACVQRWQQTWETSRALLRQLDERVIPIDARVAFVAFFTAWTASQARWWLRWEARVLLTPRIQTILHTLRSATPAERCLLSERRALWRDHYQRYVERHPWKREDDYADDGDG